MEGPLQGRPSTSALGPVPNPAPGNVLLAAWATGLPNPSAANVTRLVTLDREVLTERAGRLSASNLEPVLAGIDTLLGRG